MKKTTVFTLLVTMVTMKEGNHRWPKLALTFYVSIRFQVTCTSRLCTASFFFSNYTYLIYVATDLVYVAPNPPTQDSLVPCFTLSRVVASKLNHLAQQFSTQKIIDTGYSLQSDHLVACLNYVIFLFRPKKDMRKWKSYPRQHGSKLLMQRTSMQMLFCDNLCRMCDFVCCGLRSEVWF